MNKACIFFKISDVVMHRKRNFEKFPDVTVEKDITYDDKYGKYTRADVFYTAGRESYPVIVNVHGGGFVKGDKRHRAAICSKFARKGWLVFNINYRLAPQFAFPAGVEDTVNFLRYLPGLAEKYPLDLDKVVLTGDSAGAYYAAAAVVASINTDYQRTFSLPDVPVRIHGFMGFCGAYALEKMIGRKTPLGISRDVATALLGFKVKSDFSNLNAHPLFAHTNLIDYVNADFPKSYLAIAKYDSFVGGQGELMEQALEDNGVECTAYYAKNKEDYHGFHLLPKHPGTEKCMAGAYEWLKTMQR